MKAKYNKEPLEIKVNAPFGNYEVTVTIKAHSDTIYRIYSQSRRFIVLDREIKSGEEQTITFIANVYSLFSSNGTAEKNGVEVYILTDGDITATAAVTPVNLPTLWILGDSTVTDQPSEYPYIPESTYCGWGQAMPLLLNGKIAVSNHAESGRTTQDAIDHNFAGFYNDVKPGDFVMIEFGHNDQKIAELDAYGGFKKNLVYLAKKVMEKGATPIINSSINRIIFDRDDTILNLLGDYQNAAKEAAAELNVPFIDMWTATTEFFEPLGLYTSKQFFRHDSDSQDYTHTNDLGGVLIAKMCAGLISRANIPGLSENILTDRLEIEKPTVSADAPKEYNYQEFTRLKSIGLGNVPADSLSDIDADITNI